MFTKIKGALINALEPTSGSGTGSGGGSASGGGGGGNRVTDGGRPSTGHHSSGGFFSFSHSPDTRVTADRGPPLKFRYTRPQFLQLNTDDEIQVSADHVIRPILVPRDITKLPWNTGYAECINAGKSIRNEDQASVCRGLLRAVISPETVASKVADMMPMVPGYPRQIPVSAAKGLSSSEPLQPHPPQPGSGHHVNELKPAEKAEDPSKSKPDSLPLAEGTSGQDKVQVNGEVDPLRKPADSLPLNGSDLLSPTTPLPLQEILPSLASPVSEINDSVFKTPPSSPGAKKTEASIEESLPWIYFGIFDGHAGSGVAVAASNVLHKIIQERLQSIADLLIAFGLKGIEAKNGAEGGGDDTDGCIDSTDSSFINRSQTTLNGSVIVNHDNHLARDNIALLFHPATDKIVTVDSLIIGALEAAFWEMDHQIALDKRSYRMSGGCTAVAALFILGKLYIANAGDSRAILYKNSQSIPMSFDFTPESERERIKYLGLLRPELLGNDFTYLEFVRRPNRRDLGKKLLYRDAFMSGWTYKTVTTEDLKFPLVYGEGKRSRVLATIGVTRGFGDHELKAQNSQVDIKPFLSAQPEVRVLDLEKEVNITESDVLIMGTDGLWDITSNEKAVETVQKSLDHFPANDDQRFKYRYISAAQDLVMQSRGKSKERGKGWKTAENKAATIDDISVFVIPLKPYREEYLKWKEARNLVKKKGGFE